MQELLDELSHTQILYFSFLTKNTQTLIVGSETLKESIYKEGKVAKKSDTVKARLCERKMTR
jgi:hypothetical protein